MAEQSILHIFLQQVQQRGQETAALTKEAGTYRPVSWSDMWTRAQRIAHGFLALGVNAQDRVALISQSRIEWCLADVAVMAVGAISVPIYPSLLTGDCHFILENSGCRIAVTEDATQTAKLLECRAKLDQIVKVIQISGAIAPSDGWVISLADLEALTNPVPDALSQRMATLTPESILTIIYTSGTTGKPKGVVLTHAAMIFEAGAVQKIDLVRQSDVQLLFLPLAHVFAKMLEVAWYAVGHVMAFAENMNTIKENLAEVRPTLMCGVPRIFEKFFGAVVEKVHSAGGMKLVLFEKAMVLSQKNGEAEIAGKSLGLLDGIVFTALKRIVLSKVGAGINQTLGGRMRLMVSGGAPLAKKIGWFFRDIGVNVVEGYGLTETCAGTFVNRIGHNQIGTVGPALPGTQVRIAEDGEILLKSPALLREYWQDPQATAESLKDGWFYTGDIGELDPRSGALTITDRKKDLIVTAGGKNIAPQRLENLLKTNKLVSQAVVHGDRRKFISAVLTLDPDKLNALAKSKGFSGDYAALTQHPEILREVQLAVDAVNRELASFESIKKFKVLDKDFSIDSGELTPKLSVKRKVVNQRYAAIFDAFYADDST